MFDDFMKMRYSEKMKVDPLSLRPEHERKCMADIILQHEGEDLIIQHKIECIKRDIN